MGPLSGVRVIEFSGVGPVPFCGMLLADLGAEVIRIDRTAAPNELHEQLGGGRRFDILGRGKRSLQLDLKSPQAVEICLSLLKTSNALLEGFRPGVMERLGLGPEPCLSRRPQLVYGRMTGWGQTGPLSQQAGHDINYIALSGALHAMGDPKGKPLVPLNLVGDLGGGALYLALGILAALLETSRSGKGQVVDAAMIDGAASLMSMFYGFWQAGSWSLLRGTNFIDGAAHFYDTYETRDGRWIAVGAVEPQFYGTLLETLGLAEAGLGSQFDPETWQSSKDKIAEVILGRTRDEWCAAFETVDACVTPVLTMAEAPSHPHNTHRQTFASLGGIVQPNAAPRFSRTRASVSSKAPAPGEHTTEILEELGYGPMIAELVAAGVIGPGLAPS